MLRVTQKILFFILLGAVIVLLFLTFYRKSPEREYVRKSPTFSAEKQLQPINADDVRTLLSAILDPELGVSIVDLGLIYNVSVISSALDITMTLTVPGCPFGTEIIDNIKEKLTADPRVRIVNLHLTFNPPWSWERVSPETRERIVKRMSHEEVQGWKQ